MNWSSRMHPQLVSAQRMLVALEGQLAWSPLTWLRSPLRKLHDLRRALLSALEARAAILSPSSELLSLLFFVLLIALTFLI